PVVYSGILPTTSTSAGSRPTSSSASRRAVWITSGSRGSTRPPGNATWPECWRRWVVRSVRSTTAPPGRSMIGTSTEAGRGSPATPGSRTRSDCCSTCQLAGGHRKRRRSAASCSLSGGTAGRPSSAGSAGRIVGSRTGRMSVGSPGRRVLTSASARRHARPTSAGLGFLRVLAHRELFLDARGLARPVAQVVELGTAHIATALDDDGGDQGRVQLEGPLDALARGDLAHGERGIQATVATGNDHALVRLDPLARTLDDIDVHDDGIARREVGDVLAQAGDFLLFEQLDDVHFGSLGHRAAALRVGVLPAQRMVNLQL